MKPIDELVKTYPRVEYSKEAPLVENVIVGDQRIVFNKDWSINLQGSHHYLYWDCNFNAGTHSKRGLTFDQRCEELANEAKNRGTQELPDDVSYALCTHYWHGYPFGHWFETLAALRFIPDDNWKVIVNKTDGPVSTRDIDIHLELIGVPPERQIFTYFWGPAPICKRLYCPTIDALIGHMSKEAIDWLRMKYLNHHKVKAVLDNVPRKLYLSRNYFTHPNPIWTRKVLNEEEVWSYLESKGYTLVKGTEPLLDLIKMFNSATHIVFPHGSLVCYGIFCSKHPRIIECMSEHRVRNDNIELLVNNGIVPIEKYKILISTGTDPITNDIRINMDDLRKEIE